MMLLKRFASIAFALAFITAINLFGGLGREYMSVQTARILFMVFGAIALVLNLLSFQSGKQGPIFNFLYWAGSIVAFIGLILQQFHIRYALIIVIAGMVILGASFILPYGLDKLDPKEKEDLIDDL